ncbi:EamA family transporter [Shinella sp. AETb1-6]|jgi:drug/metabolite transporter (DMT)-like permease|uniref:DMT family transporter n=2 Tax=Shinella TaxID=323620 RepID=A0AA50CHK8_9HYPH|nr:MULTISPECIES: DMT family transporter [Shinella]MDP9589609.1 drug/metabolite transporter (DMT)-like permease [Shinella zoogloeoides]MCD1263971.1 EamA family transporter [Shinella sumterensis]MXN51408.1 EamA family transporter [Shinella sp. AETb1-6]TFE99484.1 EamA family transporter [Shinella sumterensis]WLR95990.1 DMT family transporter [Shinella sumterensis]
MDMPHHDPMRGIFLKIASVVIFLCMSTLIKAAGKDMAAGQITFLRSAFAMVPIIVFLAFKGQLVDAFRTRDVMGHLKRGFVGILAMGFGFYGLVHLPLPEAIAIGYAMPLIAVVIAAVFLKEKVGIYRWSAVLVGLTGVFIITWPRLTLFREGGVGSAEAMGALAVLLSATLGAVAMVLVRKLVKTERTHTIVLYFSLSASVFSLATLPFGWNALGWEALGLLAMAGFCGGVAQLLLTASYRYADVSTIAPFEYTSIVLGLAVGYFLFGDIPTSAMLIGTAIVVSAGIFIILREHRLGLQRRAARKHVTPQG